jgi:pimeloyl-ACP methyl ester carboxylesterase
MPGEYINGFRSGTFKGHYFEVGGTGRPVIALHGFGESIYAWRHLAPGLAATHQVHLLDLRGHGRSEMPADGCYAPRCHADLVFAYIQHHQLTDVTVIGHSMGGGVALLLSVIGRAYLWLLRVATSFLRGPIAGLSVSFISAGLALVFFEQMLEALPLQADTKLWLSDRKEWLVVLVLIMLIAFGFRIARKSKPDDVWWADIAVGSALIAALLLASIVWIKWRNPYMGEPAATLFVRYYPALRYVWVPWAVAVHVAGAIYLLAHVSFLPSYLRLQSKGAGIALALVFLQSSMWLAMVPVASYYIISQVRLFENAKRFCETTKNCPDISTGRLFQMELGVIFLVNFAALLLISFVSYRLYRRRWLLTEKLANQPDQLAKELPPLIVNRRILTAIGIGAAVILTVLGLILSDMLRDHFKLDLLPNWITYKAFYAEGPEGRHWIRTIMAALFWSPVFLAMRGLWSILGTPVQNYGLVSVRQLTDHFFRPRQSFAWWLSPRQRAARTSLPRREMLQTRLDNVIAGVLPTSFDPHPLDSLIFVAHSQGTVVLLEHLKNLAQTPTNSVPKMHIVTLGSPIGPVYQKYAFEYAALEEQFGQFRPHVASWTNMYRINDPIGGPITCAEADFVRNIRKPAGKESHTNYWRDADVCQVVIDLIKQAGAGSGSEMNTALPPAKEPATVPSDRPFT